MGVAADYRRLRGIIPPDSRPEKALEMWAVDSHPSFLVANAQQYIIFKPSSKLLRVLVLKDGCGGGFEPPTFGL